MVAAVIPLALRGNARKKLFTLEGIRSRRRVGRVEWVSDGSGAGLAPLLLLGDRQRSLFTLGQVSPISTNDLSW